ncbi:GAF domain-containing protein [Dietzia cinnamea]|uniref:GAF domain-containing protein n=1 Tax=Dietzia cinnamea TaxID=321318 RepID=UPI0021A90592|nr:helix-turn-helix domain-containing protein [Dietzia cinnamea]MCT1638383.1 GAF domain-containing protein [Dietzia cinnamea]MCT1711412.1 GAF domain-containing protein [Dietzia cinnamea]MCT2272982.1 GAF domain-containing protein [Dietzia cinnamea]
MSAGRPAVASAIVAQSWERSRRRGIDPDRADPPVDLQGADLSEHLAAHRMAAVLPMVEKVLVSGVVTSGHLVAVADADGRLLWLYGDRRVRSRAERMAFVPGALWSDDAVGANAPGLALRHGVPVRVRGAEHFLAPAHSWSCSAAPVHDPVTGRVVGGIDVTGHDSAASDEMLALVRATALLAEAELRSTPAGVLVPGAAAGPAASASAPRLLEVLGTARPALSGHGPLTGRHAEILVLLAAHPAGLSGGALAELLAEGRLDDVSVRAEMSRLRRVLGPDVIGSRPYRLTPGTVDTDAARVAALLDADVDAAVAAYPGPLLPASDAPGVADLRDELHARVRAAALAAGTAPALRAWTAGPGREDPEAWHALGSLPGLSPAARSSARSVHRVLDDRLGA